MRTLEEAKEVALGKADQEEKAPKTPPADLPSSREDFLSDVDLVEKELEWREPDQAQGRVESVELKAEEKLPSSKPKVTAHSDCNPPHLLPCRRMGEKQPTRKSRLVKQKKVPRKDDQV